MKKSRKDESFIKKPVYPGGPKALREKVTQHLQYPAEALKHKISGTVHIRYTIDHKGTVIQSKIIAGIGYGCDEEAARLVRLLQFQVPKNRGVRVQFHKTLRVHFRLPAEKTKPAPTNQVQYSYVQKESDSGGDHSSGGGYTYTVSF